MCEQLSAVCPSSFSKPTTWSLARQGGHTHAAIGTYYHAAMEPCIRASASCCHDHFACPGLPENAGTTVFSVHASVPCKGKAEVKTYLHPRKRLALTPASQLATGTLQTAITAHKGELAVRYSKLFLPLSKVQDVCHASYMPCDGTVCD